MTTLSYGDLLSLYLTHGLREQQWHQVQGFFFMQFIPSIIPYHKESHRMDIETLFYSL